MNKDTTKQSRIRDIRKASAPQLVDALLSQSVDARTATNKNFLATKSLIAHEGGQGVTKAMLQAQLSAWCIGQNTVLTRITQLKDVLQDDMLHPLFLQLQQCEQSILRISKHLMTIDEQQHKATKTTKASKAKSDDTAVVDIATLFADEVSSE